MPSLSLLGLRRKESVWLITNSTTEEPIWLAACVTCSLPSSIAAKGAKACVRFQPRAQAASAREAGQAADSSKRRRAPSGNRRRRAFQETRQIFSRKFRLRRLRGYSRRQPVFPLPQGVDLFAHRQREQYGHRRTAGRQGGGRLAFGRHEVASLLAELRARQSERQKPVPPLICRISPVINAAASEAR